MVLGDSIGFFVLECYIQLVFELWIVVRQSRATQTHSTIAVRSVFLASSSVDRYCTSDEPRLIGQYVHWSLPDCMPAVYARHSASAVAGSRGTYPSGQTMLVAFALSSNQTRSLERRSARMRGYL